MSFISFNENYYRQKLEEYESRSLSNEDVYEAKQLLKVLDDLADEGYTNLNDRMESDFSCLTRLRTLLEKSGADPFPVVHDRISDPLYSDQEYELDNLLEQLIKETEKHTSVSDNPFLEEIYRFSEWIGFDEDTAYIFLLRDALLPYVFFRTQNRRNIYPWLISRRFLADITETENMDDDIRLPLYDALESGFTEYEDFSAYCRKRILPVLDAHPQLKSALSDLLGSIRQNRIIAVESGYMGTVPMMLKALDDRVDFRLFTAAPFLYDTYRHRIFCRRYEDIRRFETVYSQDLLLQYSSFDQSRFYAKLSGSSLVRGRSLAEMKLFVQPQQI